MLGEARQRLEDAHVVLVVGAHLEAVALRDDERDLEDVDRIEAEAFAVERRLGIDRFRGDVEVQGLDQQRGDLALQGRCGRKSFGLEGAGGKNQSSLSKAPLAAPHSTRAPEALTSGSYLASSPLTKAANRSGAIGIGSA